MWFNYRPIGPPSDPPTRCFDRSSFLNYDCEAP